jgi:hypothetical protein
MRLSRPVSPTETTACTVLGNLQEITYDDDLFGGVRIGPSLLTVTIEIEKIDGLGPFLTNF